MQDKKTLIWRLVTIAAILFFVLAGIYFLFNLTSDSKKLEQQLIDRHGWAGDYIPSADGSIEAGQVERFIRVREAVQSSCTEYQDVLKGIIDLDALEDDEDLSGEEAASTGIRGVKSMFKVGPAMVHFMDARNTTLLEENMGIGEYMYLYLSAYGKQLTEASASPYAEMEEAYISDRTRKEYLQILGHQQDELGAVEKDPELEAFRSHLNSEIRALEDGTHLAPWPQGPPGVIANSLAPYQERISELYCEGIVAMELLQKNRGFWLGG